MKVIDRKLSNDIVGQRIEEMARYNDDDRYPEETIRRHYKGEVKRLKGTSRVNDLWSQFEKLSKIEKDNFINKLTNYIRK